MKIFGKIIYGIFIALLIGVVGVFAASALPIPGNIEVKIVKSGSMDPTIKTGSVVIVKPSDSYVVGDVITFGEDSAKQIPTTHRIVSAQEKGGVTYFMTKGDANEEADQTEIAKSEVIGKVIVDVPYAGFVLDFARQPLGFVLLIGIPAVVIIVDEVGRITKEIVAIRRRKKEEAEIKYEV